MAAANTQPECQAQQLSLDWRKTLARLRRWANRPGSFYKTILAAFVALEALNLCVYLMAPNLVHRLLPTSAQLFSLTVGSLFLFRALQLFGSVGWMMLTTEEPLPQPLEASDPALPYVTVQIPLRNEQLSVARLSIDSAFALSYPRSRLQVLVMDNSDSAEQAAEIRRYVESQGGEFFHRDGVDGYKARNLNLLLPHSRGEFLVILDADSVLASDTLLRALPFFADRRVAFVQLRIDTVNEDTNLVTRVGAMAARTKTRLSRLRNRQGFVTFEGHNGILRKSALEQVDGWSEEVSEDLATAINLRLAGFRAEFLDVASGEAAPERFPEMMKQRRKWSYGTGSLLLRNVRPIVRSSLPWYEKFDLILFMASLGIDGFAFLTIFAYIPVPLLTVTVMLTIFFLPILLGENYAFGRALTRFVPFVAIMAALMPTLAYGTFLSIIGRNEPFPVTLKGNGKPQRFRDLLKMNRIGIASAFLFFSISCFVVRDLAHFFRFYTGSCIVMISALAMPFILNYLRNSEAPGSTLQARTPSRFEEAPALD